MFALIGLGNPGAEYAGTRHNIGFMVIDAVAQTLGGRSFEEGHGEYLIARRQIGSVPGVLIKPLTYMNNSGIAFADVLARFGVLPEETLTITDDIHLSLGTLRIRLHGTHGGHNGLRSIIERLGSVAFPRLRCGIGRPEQTGEDLAEYVLSPFAPGEGPVVAKMILSARDAAIAAVTETPDAIMRRFNGKNIN
jgi:PTH1 family peptidyl-tRNA hydrolase